MEKWLDILSQCPIFRRLSAGEIANVFEHVPWRTDTFGKGAILFRAGETATKIGIILSGCLEMRKCLSTGNAVSLFQRRSGEMVGGGIVFSSRPEYPCDVIAREKSLVLWIDREAMLALFFKNNVGGVPQRFPYLAEQGAEAAVRAANHTNERERHCDFAAGSAGGDLVLTGR